MPERVDIAAVVLAAGSSQRFGADKLLHPLGLNGLTLPLAAHSLLPWLAVFEQVTVVVRPDSRQLRAAIANALGATSSTAIHWQTCTDAALGMASSLACGVRANRDSAGWMIGLADMPAVPASVIGAVRSALAGGATLAAATRNGRRGHPVGFAARYYEELQDLQGDSGARHLLERDASGLVLVASNSPGIHADIDVPADLHAL